MTTYTIRTEDVTRALPLGDKTISILHGVNLGVAPGEWAALTGPSGSGKSTLLGLLAGIDRPSSGAVYLGEQAISRLPEKDLARIRNQQIGLVFQTFNLIPTMTALENTAVPLYISPQRRQARRLAGEMLQMVGLGNRLDHLPHQLSGGQQQRVAIARALVTRPRLLLADEPTGNLDSAASAQVMALIERLRDELGLTVLMVTHDRQIAGHADRILHMIDGRLVDPPHNGAAATMNHQDTKHPKGQRASSA
jgi:putative ABC transport system ATP-binding protein